MCLQMNFLLFTVLRFENMFTNKLFDRLKGIGNGTIDSTLSGNIAILVNPILLSQTQHRDTKMFKLLEYYQAKLFHLSINFESTISSVL